MVVCGKCPESRHFRHVTACALAFTYIQKIMMQEAHAMAGRQPATAAAVRPVQKAAAGAGTRAECCPFTVQWTFFR